MRNRGNNEVAPDQDWLNLWKLDSVTWEAYQEYYLIKLKTPDAQRWMQKRAEEAKIGNILLVCFEKDATQCHRRLLAEEIASVSEWNTEERSVLSDVKCPLWHPKMNHPDHCCRLVGCDLCKNIWCQIGNPKVKAPMFYGYLAVKVKSIIISYMNITKLMRKEKDCFVHNPREEEAREVKE